MRRYRIEAVYSVGFPISRTCKWEDSDWVEIGRHIDLPSKNGTLLKERQIGEDTVG